MKTIRFVSFTKEPSESIERLTNELQIVPEPHLELCYGKAVSKLDQYQFFQQNDIAAVPWTTDAAVASGWLREGETVMARTHVKGATGKGIVVVKPGDPLPEAKVYTKYLSHKREFRVNLLKGKVVNFREKLRMNGRDGDFHVRNHANGYTTALPRPLDEAVNRDLFSLAEAAAKVSPSDIVGVDVGYNVAKNSLFVLEVNGGPSVEGSSVREMAAAIRALAEKDEHAV